VPEQLPNWVAPVAALLGAIFVAIANYAVQRWRYRIDRLSASIDNFCNEVNDTADLSTEYWLLDPSTEVDHIRKARFLEPQLIGRQMRLQSLALALQAFDKKLVMTRTNMLLLEFYEAITGGDFRVSGRTPSPDNAQRSQACAAQINGEVRHAVGLRSHRFT
jgi:hypothetical protein